MNELMLHSKLRARYVVECIIETRSPVRIGAGEIEKRITAIDLPIYREEVGPVVPGSSIKGVLRAYFQRIINALPENKIEELNIKRSKCEEEGEKLLKTIKSSNTLVNLFREMGTICKLFGISGFASPLKISDARPLTSPKIITRAHVKLDIGTDRVSAGPFTTEAVAPKNKFKFKMIFDELDDELIEDANQFFTGYMLKALMKGIEVFIGWGKSRGYGFSIIKAELVKKYTPEDLLLGKEGAIIKEG